MHKQFLPISIILMLLLLSGCMGIAGMKLKSSELGAGVKMSDYHPDWGKRDRCTKCHMAWTWEYGYYRGWDRHGLISDYSKVSPAGYKDPYGIDVPVNTYADYYYTDWWKGEWLEEVKNSTPEMHLDGYGDINDGTATAADFKGTVVVVDTTGNGDALTVQGGIDMAKTGETVFVKSGTYKELVVLKEGIRLWGENPYTTIIDSENKGSTIVAANGCDISGLTVTGTGFDYGEDRFRAAIHAIDCDSTLIIRGNIFFSNSVFGVLVESSRSDGYTTKSADRYIAPENALENLEYSCESNPRIIGNTFYNIGERAIFCIHSSPEIANNVFIGNLKTLGMTQLSKPFIHHNIFYRNSVSINVNRSTPVISHNIMINNHWGQRIMEGARPVIHNNITWNSPYYNEFDEDGGYLYYPPVPGTNEREFDPKFVDADAGDFKYLPDSPLAGHNRSKSDYGIIVGPGIQVPPTVACEYSWADEFIHRTDETNAIIAALDAQNERIASLDVSYTVTYRSFMEAEYDSSGNQLDFDILPEPVSGTDYHAVKWNMADGKREKRYACSLFCGEKCVNDSGTVLYDGNTIHVLNGMFKPDQPNIEDEHMVGELPARENIGGLYFDYDQYLNGSIGPAGTFYYGYLRILGGEVLPDRENVDGHECVVVRYPHLGSDQVYKFFLDPELGYRPRRLEQYFEKKLYRRIDDYHYVECNDVVLPVAVRITDYAVKDPYSGRVIGVTAMRLDPGDIRLNGQSYPIAQYLPENFDYAVYAKNNTHVPPPKVKKHKKKN